MPAKHAELIMDGLKNIAKELGDQGKHGSKAVVLNAVNLIDELLPEYDPEIDTHIEKLRSVAGWLNNYASLFESSNIVNRAADCLEAIQLKSGKPLSILNDELFRTAQELQDTTANRKIVGEAIAALRGE